MGIPFDIILEQLTDNNFVIDWVEFIQSAIACGWSIKTLYKK